MRGLTIKKILISKYFTKEAFLNINTELKDYSVKQVKQWEPDIEAEALIIRSKDFINADFLSKFPKLKIVVSATSGFDHFDLDSIQNTPLKFCYSPSANVNAAAELSLFHILSFLKKGHALLDSKNSKKNLHRSPEILGAELSQKKVLIVGLGRIGSLVSRSLHTLGCEVFAYDPYILDQDFLNSNATKVSLGEGLKNADIISLHCPLTRLTKHIIDEAALSETKNSCLIVNCARGPLIDEAALIRALEHKQVLGACLDVFEKEPLLEQSPLLKFENVITSPHIGGYTTEAQKKSALEAAQQVKKWFEEGEPVLSLIPPEVAWKNDLA